MDNTSYPNNPSDELIQNGNQRGVPDSSTLSGKEKAQPVEDLLNHAVQGAHDTIDYLADTAAPTVRRLDANVSAAEDAVRAQADRLRHKRDDWIGGMRATVRGSPLVVVVAALALGAMIARITR